MSERGVVWAFGAVVVLAGAVLWWQGRDILLPEPAQASTAEPPRRATLYELVGTPSCSARACHGGAGPAVGQSIHQDEYTRWLAEDRHANAFRVLQEERSQKIAQRLGLEKPAYEEVLCLACHTNPLAVGNKAQEILTRRPDGPEARTLLQERAFGVGCESCHGAAAKWLEPHVEPHAEKEFSWARKLEVGVGNGKPEDFGWKPMRDDQTRALQCVGCHVGAPADEARGLPLRDVNHDLIAAGHPRLAFELGSFQANLPPHWEKKKQLQINNLVEWHVGQILCAEAALQLLADRADRHPRPWPEFAEYDCFACHHGLQDPSWRQKRGYAGKPGSLPWGTWYFALPRVLDDDKAASPLTRLAELMEAPYPDRDQVGKTAWKAWQLLSQWRTTDLQEKWRKAKQQLPGKLKTQEFRDLLSKLTAAEQKKVDFGWDGAEQLYQFAIALSLAQGDAQFLDRNKGLTQMRYVGDGFDSPVHFRPEAYWLELHKSVKSLLK